MTEDTSSIEGKGDATLKLFFHDGTDTLRGYLRLRENSDGTSTLFFVQAETGKVVFEVVPDIKIIGILR